MRRTFSVSEKPKSGLRFPRPGCQPLKSQPIARCWSAHYCSMGRGEPPITRWRSPAKRASCQAQIACDSRRSSRLSSPRHRDLLIRLLARPTRPAHTLRNAAVMLSSVRGPYARILARMGSSIPPWRGTFAGQDSNARHNEFFHRHTRNTRYR